MFRHFVLFIEELSMSLVVLSALKGGYAEATIRAIAREPYLGNIIEPVRNVDGTLSPDALDRTFAEWVQDFEQKNARTCLGTLKRRGKVIHVQLALGQTTGVTLQEVPSLGGEKVMRFKYGLNEDKEPVLQKILLSKPYFNIRRAVFEICNALLITPAEEKARREENKRQQTKRRERAYMPAPQFAAGECSFWPHE